MLILVETRPEKIEAHKQLIASLERSWQQREHRVVTWRPSHRRMLIRHNGSYWFGSVPANPRDRTPRNWDPFGEYRRHGTLDIAVEINTPTTSNTRRVSGFFARDPETGLVYLMHDGAVGGGRKGVGRADFLQWSDATLVPVIDSQGDSRAGVIVAAVESHTTADAVSRFIQQVLDFKQAVKNGETATGEARSAQQSYKAYYDEFTGKKRRRRINEIEYISRHGDIVRALRDWRQRSLRLNERIVKNLHIDLGIGIGELLTEIYEVKPSCDRQSLYSAIGQLVVHGTCSDQTCRRFVVLPKGEKIPADINRALARASITLIRFDLRRSTVKIIG